MDYLNSILSQQNQVQLVEEAIPTLCNRLQHATLSSDRRSAVLGLKSFSRQYRESVVEYGLRPLISTFHKDSKNPIIVKAILETLLILFIRGDSDEDLTRGWISQQSRIQNGKYPSPLLMDDVSLDQFSMWIADELTQNNDVIELLLEILQEYPDFHIRLYALQLLESLVSSRAMRTKDCLLSIPTAVSVLVSLLDDPHDPVRNEAILLLMAVVNNNFNIQKLVAFENTFDKLFDIISEEGGIRGSILVQDCLTLITNLLQYNASNQKYFLETQCVPRLGLLLGEPVEEEDGESIPIVWTEQRLQNMIISLEICCTFVNEDNEFFLQNQAMMFKAGIHFTVLKLVFSPITNNQVRSIALLTAGDLIQGNPEIQFEFSRIDVPYIDPSLPSQLQTYDKPVPVSIALLNWALFINSVHAFTIRQSAAACLHAYFKDNKECKSQFLAEQIKAYSIPNYYDQQEKENGVTPENGETLENGISNEENKITTPFGNIFSTLMDYDSNLKINPYKLWFASLVLMYLFEDSDENKEIAREVKTGDETAGEEVMNSIQAISGLLITTLDSSDPRIAIGYLMLLIVWLYENCNAVNDFLSDPTITRSILAFMSNNSSELGVLTHGLTTILLGVVYEFSSKNSPIPRADLHALLVKALGRDNYTLRVKQLKECDVFKNFDEKLVFHASKDETGLPDVYFNSIFVNLIKENFSRIRKALFHDPNADPHGKISFDLFEELDTKVGELRNELQAEKDNAVKSESELKEEIEKLNTSHQTLENRLEDSNTELKELKSKHKYLSDNYNETAQSLKSMKQSKLEFETSSKKYYSELQDALKRVSTTGESAILLQSKLEATDAAKKKLEEGINNMTRDLFHLKKQKSDAENNIKKLEKDLASSRKEIKDLKSSHDSQIDKLNNTIEEFKSKVEMLQKKMDQILKEKEEYLTESREKHEDLEATNEHLMDKLRAASATFQELKHSKASNDKEIEILKEQLDTKDEALKEIGTLKKQLAIKQEELKDIGEQVLAKDEGLKEIEYLQKQLSIKDSALKEIDALQEQISVKDIALKEIDTLREQIVFKDEALKEIDTLKAEIGDLSKGKQEIILELETLKTLTKSTIEQMTKKLELIQTSNDELVSQNELLQDDIKKLKDELKEKGEKYDILREESESLQKDLEEKNRTLSLKLEAAENLVTSSKDTHLSVAKEFATFREDHTKIKGDLTEQLNAALEKHKSSLKDLDEKSTTIKNLKESHQADLGSLKEKNLATSEKIASIESELSNSRDQLSSTKKRVLTLESELTEAQKLASDEQTKVSKSIAASDKIQLELEKLKSHNEKLQNSFDLKSDELELVQKQFASTKDEIEALNSQIKELNKLSLEKVSVIDELNKLLLEKSETIAELRQKVADIENNLTTQTELVEQTIEEKDKLQEEVGILLAELETTKFSQQAKLEELNLTSESRAKLITELKQAADMHKQEALKLETKISTLEKELEVKTQKLTIDSDNIKELQKKLESEQSAHTLSKETIVTLNEEVSKINKSLEISKGVENDLHSSTEELTKKLKISEKAFASTKTKLSNEISELKSKIAERDGKIKSLETDLKEKILDVENERAMLSENSETVIKQYADKIKSLEETLKIAKQEHSEKVNIHSNEKTTLQRKLDDLSSDYEGLNTDSEDVKKELKELQENCEADRATITAKDSEIKQLQGSIESMNKSRSLLEKDLTVFKQKLEQQTKITESKEDELTKLKTEIISLEEELSTLRKDLKTAEVSSSELSVLFKEVQNTSKSQADLIIKLRDDVLKLSDTKKELTDSIQEKEKEVVKCKEELQRVICIQKDNHDKSSNKLNGEIEALKSDIANKQREFEDLQKSKEENSNESKAESKTLKMELSNLKSELTKIEVELAKGKTENSQLTKSNETYLAKEADLETSNTNLKLELERVHQEKKEVDVLIKAAEQKQIASTSAITKLETDLSAVTDVKNSIESKLKVAMEESKNQKSENTTTIVRLEAELAKIKDEKDAISSKLEETLKNSKQLQNSTITKLEAELAKLEADLAKANDEKDAVSSKLEETLENSKQQQTESSSTKSKLETDLSSLRNEVEDLKKSVSTIEQIEKENKNLKEKIKEAEVQENDFKILSAKLQEAEAKVKESNEAFEKFKAETNSKEKDSTKSDASELEDLMLLMDDMDETNKKYKARLKALGEEMSSEEESEEESDEDEE